MTSASVLAEKVRTTFGLRPRSSWAVDIASAAVDLSRRHDCPLVDIFERADRDRALLEELVEFLTVGETFFLRLPEHFDYLTHLAGQRLHRISADHPLTIWSAGCATGEEPYSAAISLEKRLGLLTHNGVRIIASDVNRQAIETAREGVYKAWSFRGAPAWLLSNYFQLEDGAGCRLLETIRDAVTFERIALADHLIALPSSSLDVVFFRNVAIYLEKKPLQAVYEGIRRVLRKDGVLFLAPSDPLPPASLFQRVDDGVVGVFQTNDSHASQKDSRKNPTGKSYPRIRPGPNARVRATPPAGSTPKIRSRAPQPSGVLRSTPIQTDDTVPPPSIPALHAANAGELTKALGLAAELIAQAPASASAYLLRGQLNMGTNDVQAAISDLRCAVFLAPEDQVARFWYASALQHAAHTQKSLGQLRELGRQLALLPQETILSDGKTSAGELLRAAELMKEPMA